MFENQGKKTSPTDVRVQVRTPPSSPTVDHGYYGYYAEALLLSHTHNKMQLQARRPILLRRCFRAWHFLFCFSGSFGLRFSFPPSTSRTCSGMCFRCKVKEGLEKAAGLITRLANERNVIRVPVHEVKETSKKKETTFLKYIGTYIIMILCKWPSFPPRVKLAMETSVGELPIRV